MADDDRMTTAARKLTGLVEQVVEGFDMLPEHVCLELLYAVDELGLAISENARKGTPMGKMIEVGDRAVFTSLRGKPCDGRVMYVTITPMDTPVPMCTLVAVDEKFMATLPVSELTWDGGWDDRGGAWCHEGATRLRELIRSAQDAVKCLREAANSADLGDVFKDETLDSADALDAAIGKMEQGA